VCHLALMSGVLAGSLILTADVNARSAGTVSPRDPVTAATTVTVTQEGGAAEVPETPEVTAFLDPVACRAAARAASRLRSRARDSDTRQARRDMDEAAAAETGRLQNMGGCNPTEDALGRREDAAPVG
jgi:hypothetical protein